MVLLVLQKWHTLRSLLMWTQNMRIMRKISMLFSGHSIKDHVRQCLVRVRKTHDSINHSHKHTQAERERVAHQLKKTKPWAQRQAWHKVNNKLIKTTYLKLTIFLWILSKCCEITFRNHFTSTMWRILRSYFSISEIILKFLLIFWYYSKVQFVNMN